MMSYIFTYVLCFTRISTIESSSHWISLSAAGVNPGHTNDGRDFIHDERKDELTIKTSTLPTEPTYPTEVITDRTTISSSDRNEELMKASSTTSTIPKVDSEIYVRLPGSNNFTQTDHAVAILNRKTFTEDIIWKMVENNRTKIQVSLYPAIQDGLPDFANIQVNFDPVIKNENLSKFCEVLNNTCGPIVEINAQQSRSRNDHGTRIVEILFNKTKLNSYNGNGSIFKCVYWHEEDNSWRNDGLETDNSESDFVICHSTHLTLFSVLLDPQNVLQSYIFESIPNNHEMILTMISVAGSFVTILCVLITMGSYLYLCKEYVLVITNNEALKRRLSRKPISETTRILLHSCVALLLTHLSFQAYHWFGDRINCRVMNFLTHYSVTTFLMWAACDGLNMWRMLFNDIFNLRGRCFYQTCFIISWGLPLLTTIAGVLETNYPFNECQLSFNKEYEFAFYFLPCSIILGSNLLLFVWMMAKVICKNSLKRLREKKVKYVLALAQVFNTVWCVTFPLLWFRNTRLLGQYLMAVLVSTQGILMLIVRCAKHSELKLHLWNTMCVRRAKFLSLPSFLTSNSTKTTSSSKSKCSESSSEV